MKTKIINSIKGNNAVIGIIGLGYVGLPLAINFAKAGFRVIGFDKNQSTLTSINKAQSPISHISNEAISQVKTKIKATKRYEHIKECNAIIICLPTPLDSHRQPDLSYIIDSIKEMSSFLQKGQLISLESTTYPGTTKEVLMPAIEKLGFTIGKDFFLVYSPEREDPGNKNFELASIPKICGGVTSNCLDIGYLLYSQVISRVIPVSSPEVAELTKLLENIHRSINIGLVNEMKVIADSMGIDIFEVIRGAATKPFGFVPYWPGPGLGGHCIPIDPFYLSWKAKEFGLNARFIELAGEVNIQMHDWVVNKIIVSLNKIQQTVKNSKILILGTAYKKNVSDVRESPSITIIDRLLSMGAKLKYHDPYVKEINNLSNKKSLKSLKNLNKNVLSQFDVVVLLTDHDAFDYATILKHSNYIVDTRGRYKVSKKVSRA